MQGATPGQMPAEGTTGTAGPSLTSGDSQPGGGWAVRKELAGAILYVSPREQVLRGPWAQGYLSLVVPGLGGAWTGELRVGLKEQEARDRWGPR